MDIVNKADKDPLKFNRLFYQYHMFRKDGDERDIVDCIVAAEKYHSLISQFDNPPYTSPVWKRYEKYLQIQLVKQTLGCPSQFIQVPETLSATCRLKPEKDMLSTLLESRLWTDYLCEGAKHAPDYRATLSLLYEKLDEIDEKLEKCQFNEQEMLQQKNELLKNDFILAKEGYIQEKTGKILQELHFL